MGVMITKASLIAALMVLSISSSRAQYVDPQSVLDLLLLRQFQRQAEQDQAERLALQRQSLYRQMSADQIMGELQQYCPSGEPPCQWTPPGELLKEAAARGLIVFKPAPPQSPDWPGMTCITTPDYLGGSITDCQ